MFYLGMLVGAMVTGAVFLGCAWYWFVIGGLFGMLIWVMNRLKFW